MTYEQHMTTEYDEKFCAVEYLAWDPWVGKNYQKTGIFVVGMSTDKRDGGDWTQDSAYNLGNPRNASRALAAWVNKANEPPFRYCNGNDGLVFQNTAKMFIEGVKAKYDERTCAAFWGAVAFNNFFQKAIQPNQQVWETDEELREEGRKAFHATTKIIQPKLVLVLGVETADAIGAEKCDEIINGTKPRFASQTPPIVGIHHPSGTGKGFDSNKWLDFLCNHPVSKKPIQNFLQYLKHQIN